MSTWICAIAVNLCRTRVRRRQRERGRLSPDPLPRTPDPRTPDRMDIRIDLERAIDALPDRARETIILRHIHGFSLRETAEVMGVTPGTVKSQLSRACRLIRERLDDD